MSRTRLAPKPLNKDQPNVASATSTDSEYKHAFALYKEGGFTSESDSLLTQISQNPQCKTGFINWFSMTFI